MMKKFVFLVIFLFNCVSCSFINVSASSAKPYLDTSITDMSSYGLNVYTIDIDVVNRPSHSVVAVASYDSLGNMLQFKNVTTEELKTTLDKNKVYRIKSFLWDSFSSIKPLADCDIYTNGGGAGGSSSSPSNPVSPPDIMYYDTLTDEIKWRYVSNAYHYNISVTRVTYGIETESMYMSVIDTSCDLTDAFEQLVSKDKQPIEEFKIQVCAVGNGWVSCSSVIYI